MPDQRKLPHTALCYVLLALVTVAVYLPVIELNFVTFDDTYYVTNNPKVQAGLTWASMHWAFTRAHAANWHPLTWLSHMLDCQLYGLKPAGHHVTNLLFHTADTLLLFALLKRLTGAVWRSAFVAALFALHPLHVESVAWVAERKDVLSTFFFLLTLLAYTRYAERSRVLSLKSRVAQGAQSKDYALLFYVLSLVLFALGLMAKPMLVTVPFVLLLLDWWPLGRMHGVPQSTVHAPRPPSAVLSTLRSIATEDGLRRTGSTLQVFLRLVLEKAPFFLLAAASCVVTVIAQRQGGALSSFAGESGVSLESRLTNTPISYAWYLAKLLWPSNLAVLYPFERIWPPELVLGATVLLLGITGFVLWQRRRRPFLAVGWLWYLGTLVPVIGLVKVGAQSIADRYTYIPAIGLFMMLAWGVADLTAGWRQRAMALALGAAAVLGTCAVAVGAQLLYWQDSEPLFRHALAVTRNNYIAWNNLGLYLAEQGELEVAKKYYRKAMEIAPGYPFPLNNLASTLMQQKKFDEAISLFEAALRLRAQSAEVESNYGAALYSLDKIDEAMIHLQNAIRYNPEYALAHYNLGSCLMRKQKTAEAAEEFRVATRLNPRYADAHSNLGLALAKLGKKEEAAACFRRALAIEPRLAPAHYGLAELLSEQGQYEEAAEQFAEVVRLKPDYGPAWAGQGAARVSQGRLDEAVAAFSAAVRIAPDDVSAQCQLAGALAAQHQTREAIQHYRAALKEVPDFPEALNNLAWILAANPDAQVRNGKEAVELAERACKLTEYKQAMMVGTLAAAYAEAGRFPEAVATAEKARTLAQQANRADLADRNRALRELYRAGQPARDTP